MAIHIIIDGYNLIRRSAYFSAFDQQDLAYGREALIDALAAYKRLKSHKITVVFDGTRNFDNFRKQDRIKGVNIVFSQFGEEADHVIKRLAGREKEKALVVTSDRDIIASVQAKGASVAGASEFEEKIVMAGLTSDASPDEISEGWNPTTKKKGPSRRLSKKRRRDRRRMRKL